MVKKKNIIIKKLHSKCINLHKIQVIITTHGGLKSESFKSFHKNKCRNSDNKSWTQTILSKINLSK